MRSIYTLFCLLVFTAAGAQQKLAIIGSSTSACTGPSSFANCYVAKLDAYYEGLGQPTDIAQLAVGGYTVYKGMPTGYVGPSPNLQPDVNNNITQAISLAPNVILVNYPSNGYDTLRVDSIMKCFRRIKQEANSNGLTCFITTTQPRHAFPFNNFAARQKLKELRDSILLQFGYFAINFWDGIADPSTYEILPAYNNGDNIHLNDAGHQILFERVRDKNIFAVGLPVKVTAFAARWQQGKVLVSWSALDETAGTRYEVQRSADALSYETIHTATAAGQSTARSYQVPDAQPLKGAGYYRLKVTENGRTFYSTIATITSGKNGIAITGFSTDGIRRHLVIKLDAAAGARLQVNVVNSAGMVVQRNFYGLKPGDNQFAISLNGLAAGTYWAQALANGQHVFTKGFKAY